MQILQHAVGGRHQNWLLKISSLRWIDTVQARIEVLPLKSKVSKPTMPS